MGYDTPPSAVQTPPTNRRSAKAALAAPDPRRYHQSRQDPLWVRVVLTTAALIVVGLLIVVPVVSVFVQAFSAGVPTYIQTVFGDPNTRSAILTTLTVAPTAVTLNVVFGVAAAWAVARFRFPGRALLLTLIDLPFSVSPVVAGLIFVLLFGLQGYFGAFMSDHGQGVVIAVLAVGVLVLGAAAFLRRGNDGFRLVLAVAALAALAALGNAVFFWGPDPGCDVIFALPGLILATSFVTFPFVARELIPVMEQDIHLPSASAFALASVLTLLALVTLVAKALLEHKRLPTAPEAGLKNELKEESK